MSWICQTGNDSRMEHAVSQRGDRENKSD
jgi:hypothetical protein